MTEESSRDAKCPFSSYIVQKKIYIDSVIESISLEWLDRLMELFFKYFLIEDLQS